MEAHNNIRSECKCDQAAFIMLCRLDKQLVASRTQTTLRYVTAKSQKGSHGGGGPASCTCRRPAARPTRGGAATRRDAISRSSTWHSGGAGGERLLPGRRRGSGGSGGSGGSTGGAFTHQPSLILLSLPGAALYWCSRIRGLCGLRAAGLPRVRAAAARRADVAGRRARQGGRAHCRGGAWRPAGRGAGCCAAPCRGAAPGSI